MLSERAEEEGGGNSMQRKQHAIQRDARKKHIYINIFWCYRNMGKVGRRNGRKIAKCRRFQKAQNARPAVSTSS